MSILGELGVAMTTALVLALAFFPALSLSWRRRALILTPVLVLIALSPLEVSSKARLFRGFAALWAVALLVKLYDLHVGAGKSSRPDFRSYLAFLPNIFGVVWRKLDAEPRPPAHECVRQLLKSSCRMMLAAAALFWLFRLDWMDIPFAVEHGVKVIVFFLFLIPLSQVGTALWRLAGGRAREFMNDPFRSATPAEFWLRYNRPAGQFFHENVFLPAGGRKYPIRGILITFAVSALAHEYLYGIVLGRVQGYQTVFFLLQGLAVAACHRLRPAIGWRPVGIVLTLAFNLATGMLFFASVNGILPFYSRPLPAWLADW